MEENKQGAVLAPPEAGWTSWMEYSNSTPYDLALRKETLKNPCNGLIEKAKKSRRCYDCL